MRRTNSVAHALLPPLTSPTRVILRTLDETTDSSGSPAVPQIYKSGKQRRTQHTQTSRHVVREYLILWKGYPAHEMTWEPKDNVADAPKKIAEYFGHVEGNAGL